LLIGGIFENQTEILMKSRVSRWTKAVSVVLLATLTPLTYAQMATGQETVIYETITATTYLNGGVGKDQWAAMCRISVEFPLRIVFSEHSDGEFLTDIPVVISDVQGNSIFELQKAGPILFVMLPNGTYRVSAHFEGLTKSHQVTLTGKEGKDISFHWKGTPRY